MSSGLCRQTLFLPHVLSIICKLIITGARSYVHRRGIAVASRFQRAFMKLLRDAQFEELSAQDLLLTSALKTDYLLTLPIYVDWKRASESNAIIFRPNFLSRISLSDLWKPASKENCGNNIWKMFKTSLSILFSQSIIQEPAFQELILLYTEDSPSNGDAESGEFPALQLKIYDKIPIPDLPVIFPHKKLSFRILDTVRLDVASILGLLAFLVNYKFENILSSPSALLLDVIAFSALIIYVSRVILGYKQTWDRYQDENVYSQMEVKVCLRTASLHYKLLVNKTLYEKTIASGFGSVYFLLDASEQQQYKETLLAYAILLCVVDWQVSCRKSIGTACERFMYEKFNEKVEMPIDKAVDTLLRLNLVKEVLLEENFVLQVLPCSKACEVLRQRWASLID
ncbi:hypothetical protein QJS04_geneDACA006643 [Acorus gramineus]|uniref:Uncharacterized protein n=1 Tax=Acorus gramineus TaxID=55184 RepID=A0AAV9A2P7_ACOGR|nr:hypothetical protein QJS04_geneDACA006643 [Acorus gramineus]